jgi:hypothetical protein
MVFDLKFPSIQLEREAYKQMITEHCDMTLRKRQMTHRSGKRVIREARTPDINPEKGEAIFRQIRKGRSFFQRSNRTEGIESG